MRARRGLYRSKATRWFAGPVAGCLLLLGSLVVVGCASQQVRVDDEAIEAPWAGSAARAESSARATSKPVEQRRWLPRPVLVDRWRTGALRKGGRDLPLLAALLDEAEGRTTSSGRAVLRAGRRLVLDERRIIRGSCWTYADAVYAEAGFERRQRHKVFSSGRDGPYVDVEMLRPGDFLSYINLSYRRSVHSAIFVSWLDQERKEALMLSYVGGRRVQPGGYRSYRLSHVYRVQRPRL